MLRLHRYILRQLVVALLFIVLALTGAVWLTQALRFLEFTISGGAPVGQFLVLAVYTLPPFLGVVLPLALCVAIVFIYNRLLNDSELTVMRAIGLSPVSLARPALGLGLVVALVVLVLEMVLTPRALWAFTELKNDLRTAVPVNLIRDGAFMEVARGVTVYIDERGRGGRLTGIYIHDARDPERIRTYTAATGLLQRTNEGPRIVVENTIVHQTDPDPQAVQVLSLPEYAIDLQTFIGERRPGRKDIDELTVPELIATAHAARADGHERHAQRLWSMVHKHLLMPIFALGMAWVSALLLLTARFSRHGQAGRIVVTVAVAGAIQGLALVTVNLVLRDVSLAPLAYAIAALPLAATGVLAWLGSWRGRRDALHALAPAPAPPPPTPPGTAQWA